MMAAKMPRERSLRQIGGRIAVRLVTNRQLGYGRPSVMLCGPPPRSGHFHDSDLQFDVATAHFCRAWPSRMVWATAMRAATPGTPRLWSWLELVVNLLFGYAPRIEQRFQAVQARGDEALQVESGGPCSEPIYGATSVPVQDRRRTGSATFSEAGSQSARAARDSAGLSRAV